MIPEGFDKKVLVLFAVFIGHLAFERCVNCLKAGPPRRGISGGSRKRHVPDEDT